MIDFITYIVKQLVDKPDEVKVTEVKGAHVSIYELHVGEGDMGKVIGRRGQTASAIRTLLSAASATSHRSRSILEILE
jgi:predicted RNA-binding protein YlqC (UPF0109 family)